MAMDIVRDYPLLVGALALLVLGAGLGLWQLQQRLLRSEHERRRAAEELNRRLSELFSLQELSYVLSDSLELDRIVGRGGGPGPGGRRVCARGAGGNRGPPPPQKSSQGGRGGWPPPPPAASTSNW